MTGQEPVKREPHLGRRQRGQGEHAVDPRPHANVPGKPGPRPEPAPKQEQQRGVDILDSGLLTHTASIVIVEYQLQLDNNKLTTSETLHQVQPCS